MPVAGRRSARDPARFRRVRSGRKSTRRRTCSSASTSLSKAPSATPDFVVCTDGAAQFLLAVTVSLVTVFTTSGR